MACGILVLLSAFIIYYYYIPLLSIMPVPLDARNGCLSEFSFSNYFFYVDDYKDYYYYYALAY